MKFYIFLFVLALLAFFLCAVYGFFALFARILGLAKSGGKHGHSPKNRSRGADSQIATELHLICSQLAKLRLRGDLDDKFYYQLLDQLECVYQQMDLEPPPRFFSTSGSEIPLAAAVRSPAAESRPEKDLAADVPERRTLPVVPPEEPVSSEINRPAVERTPSPFDFTDQPSVPQKDPRRPLAEILSSFMLEKNIRWGELVGGLLIVGCAVGLVISLQTQLKTAQQQVPFLVPLLFMLVTAGIHGAGIYTLRKWNLRTTSQGVLTIGLLLIPLNFLAATLLAELHETGLGLSIAALVVGGAGFVAASPVGIDLAALETNNQTGGYPRRSTFVARLIYLDCTGADHSAFADPVNHRGGSRYSEVTFWRPGSRHPVSQRHHVGGTQLWSPLGIDGQYPAYTHHCAARVLRCVRWFADHDVSGGNRVSPVLTQQ